ncbi:hypothetical protein [Staphylococcus pasteuri]|uniref:hypothetical protein n=1 Tax=Staphylococcus pasteuri TaxID=45972 RepID=UPI0032617D8A
MDNKKIIELLYSEEPVLCYENNLKTFGESRLFDFTKVFYEPSNAPFSKLDIEKTFGKYSIINLANYEKLMVIDKKTVNQNFNFLLEICVDLDSNVMGDIKDMVFDKKNNENLLNALEYCKQNNLRLSCMPYLIEMTFNDHEKKDIDIYNTLLCFSVVCNISIEELKKKKNIDEYLAENSNLLLETDARFNEMKNYYNRNVMTYKHVYILVLKMFIIYNISKKSPKNKLLEFLETMTSEYNIYFELEINVAFSYFNNDSGNIFYNIMANSKNKIKKLKALSWDVYHIRNEETAMGERNSHSAQIYLHTFLTADKGLSKVMRNNKIERMLSIDGQMKVLRVKPFEKIEDEKFIERLNDIIEQYISNKKNSIGLSENNINSKIEQLERKIITEF